MNLFQVVRNRGAMVQFNVGERHWMKGSVTCNLKRDGWTAGGWALLELEGRYSKAKVAYATAFGNALVAKFGDAIPTMTKADLVTFRNQYVATNPKP